MKRIVLLGTLVASHLVGCDLFTGYDARIQGLAPFSPPEDYAAWWEATETCSELAGDFEALEWFLATWITQDGSIAYGAWRPPHRIVIVRGYEDDELIVRHEMLHDLLSGDPDHSSPLWAGCGLVSSA